jgi:ketosteroid isomerase-like protein
MSRENVETARRIHAAFLRGDYESMFNSIADEVVWDDSRFPDGGNYRGHREMTRASGRWFGAWQDYEVEFFDYRSAGQKVVIAYRQRGRGKGSGVAVEMEGAQVITFENGKAVRIEMFPIRTEALEAAGLSE